VTGLSEYKYTGIIKPMKKLLSGNEALALGAYHAGVKVATAYPGTPSTEIMETFSRFNDIYAEWSTNEKVAMEVAIGASYAGVRSMVSLKQVGLNVATDPFMAAAITGVNGGLVIICADDPGIHSSQGEQDNRHYARLAKIPMLEPADSQEAYDLMGYAFDISELFDTPVMLRTTTRVSHSKSVVSYCESHEITESKPEFIYNMQKYVMLPVNARFRHVLVEERLVKAAAYAENFPLNRIIWGENRIGVITSGVAYQYAREVFPQASFLKLGMTYPVSENLVKQFASKVDEIIVVEELDPFLQETIQAMGVKVSGKEYIPRVGELDPDVLEEAAIKAGWITSDSPREKIEMAKGLPKRPPLFCPGCPHTGVFFTLSGIGQRLKLPGAKEKPLDDSPIIITGDIGCYTLGAYPPFSAMDTTACMGASIGKALGMEKAGISKKVVAVIGDSTFMHSGITGLVNAVYNDGKITVVILDNGTTAMTGHQEHPGTGITVQGKETQKVVLENIVRGIGITDVKVVDAFNLKEIRSSIRSAMQSEELSVVIVRGDCAVRVKRSGARAVDAEKCNVCGICLQLGCSAIQKDGEHVFIDASLCAGDACTICQQVCPKQAIMPQSDMISDKE